MKYVFDEGFDVVIATTPLLPKIAVEERLHWAGVGDENKDMVAAHLGIQTFLVPSPETKLDPSTPEPNFRGPLADLKELI